MSDRSAASTGRKKFPYAVPLPQRFSILHERYLSRGGMNDIVGDADAFAVEGRLSDINRLVFFWLAFDQIVKEEIDGDFAELGVYKGQTAAVLARKARQLGRTAYLLDTFEGFDARDFQGPDNGRGEQFTDTSLEAVRARVGEESTKYIKGYFPETAQHLPDDGKYCLVHIDCDLYAPIYSSLEYFYPRMAPGGFLIVHDYSSLAWAGADKAVDTFFADKPECIIPLPDGAGSAVIRKLRPAGSRNWMQAKRALALNEWHSAANGKLIDLLGDGWSGPENWGVWGVGSSHTLILAPIDPSMEAFDLDIYGRAAVLDARPLQAIDIFIDGALHAVWTFTTENNIATRTVRVPYAARALRGAVKIEFRPRSTDTIMELNPHLTDPRSLGLALYRLRLRSVQIGAP